MNEAAVEFHSPLSLLWEWRDRADGAPLRELLITGYTLDLVFLERHCVSTARALGARVTVLGDAAQAVHEAVDVRHAGRVYQHGHASCGGAFHPKLVLLLGDDDVWVAIGSGNPTMSGWGHNNELWVVLRAPRGRGPSALRDLGRWLVDVADVVAMPSWIAATAVEIGQTITPSEIDDSLPELRIFGNLRAPIVDQLPPGPVEALGMTAPVFDRHARAARALIEVMQPETVEIALQPTLTEYDGRALRDAASAAPESHFWFLNEERTRHGKLVEWVVGDKWTALVGSANLSSAAMRSTTDSTGNCELVAIWPTPSSILPRDTAATREQVESSSTVVWDRDSDYRSAIDILGARRLPEMVVVELVSHVPLPITIETSPDGTPDTWTAVFVVSEGVGPRFAASFRVPEQIGGTLRARGEIDGEQVNSSVVFLTDTHRCQPRRDSADRPRPVGDYDTDQLFTDPVLSSRFNADLLRLIEFAREHRKVTPLRTPTTPATAAVSEDRWGEWLDEVDQTLGPSLRTLIFPGTTTMPEIAPSGWTVGPEADPAELTDDEDADTAADTAADTDGEPVPHATRAPVIPPSQRQLWRTRCARLLTAIQSEPKPPLEYRMAVASLHLRLLAGGVWGTSESWRPALRDVVRALVPTEGESETVPNQVMTYTGTLTTVCLALLVQDASLHGGSEHDVIAQSAWSKAKSWAALAESELATDYLHRSDDIHACVPSQEDVDTIIDLATAVTDDPYAEVRAALDSEGLPAERIDGAWVIDGDLRNTRRTAARVATMVGAPCVVLARNPNRVSVVLQGENSVALAESSMPHWRIYRSTPVSTPLSILGAPDGLPSAGKRLPLTPAPEEIRQLATAAGAEPARLVAAIHASM